MWAPSPHPIPCNSTGFLLWVGGHILRSFYRQFRFDAEAEKPRLASLAQGQAAGLHLPQPAPCHPAGRASASTLPSPAPGSAAAAPSLRWERPPGPGQAVPTEKISCHQPGSTFRVPGAGPGCARRGLICAARGPGLHRGKAVEFVQRRAFRVHSYSCSVLLFQEFCVTQGLSYGPSFHVTVAVKVQYTALLLPGRKALARQSQPRQGPVASASPRPPTSPVSPAASVTSHPEKHLRVSARLQ